MNTIRISFSGRELFRGLAADLICTFYELAAAKKFTFVAIQDVKQVHKDELNMVTVINFHAFTEGQESNTANKYHFVSNHATDFSCSSTSIQHGWVKMNVTPAKVSLSSIPADTEFTCLH